MTYDENSNYEKKTAHLDPNHIRDESILKSLDQFSLQRPMSRQQMSSENKEKIFNCEDICNVNSHNEYISQNKDKQKRAEENNLKSYDEASKLQENTYHTP